MPESSRRSWVQKACIWTACVACSAHGCLCLPAHLALRAALTTTFAYPPTSPCVQPSPAPLHTRPPHFTHPPFNTTPAHIQPQSLPPPTDLFRARAGNHGKMGLYDTPLLMYELYVRGYRMRGLAHPGHWRGPLGPVFDSLGAVPASPMSAFRLLKSNEKVCGTGKDAAATGYGPGPGLQRRDVCGDGEVEKSMCRKLPSPC
eukprot:365535-Chlamydomonas_euryale.AAC.12